MADNKNIVDDVLSKGIFGKVATKYTSRARKEEVVKEAVEELPPVVEQPEPVTVEPEPAVIEQAIAVKPVKVNLVKNVYNKGAFRDIASRFVKGTLVKMIDPNKEIKITEEKEVVTKEAIEELPTVVKQPESVPAVKAVKTEKASTSAITYLPEAAELTEENKAVVESINNYMEQMIEARAPKHFSKPQFKISSTRVDDYIDKSAQKAIVEAAEEIGTSNMSLEAKFKALEKKMHQLASIYSGGGTNGGGRSAVNVLSGEHTADVTALSASIDDIKTNGVAGYDVTGAFLGKDPNAGAVWTSTTGINYTSSQASTQQVITFSLDSSIQSNTDNPYWTTPTPAAHTGVGLFGGSYLPDNVSPIFNFTEVDPDTFEDGTNIPTTGRISLSGCSFGDQLRLRFDLIVIPQITNTTVTPMLWYKNRTAGGVVTYSFELPTQPNFFGQGTVGKEYLNRVEISAWIANEEDVHALVYPAMKADNPCIIKPNSMMATILR